MSEVVKTAGKLYKKTASRILWSRYPIMPPEQQEHLIKTGDYEQLEQFVNAEECLTVVAETIRDELANVGIYLPKETNQIVLFSDDPDEELKESRNLCDIARLTNGEKAEMLIEACKIAHDLWVASSADRFFVPSEQHKRYRFMQFELIGYARIGHYYQVYIEPLANVLHLSVDSVYIERVYSRLQDAFFSREGIRNKETLCNVISASRNIPPTIREALEGDPVAVAHIATEILELNPVLRGE